MVVLLTLLVAKMKGKKARKKKSIWLWEDFDESEMCLLQRRWDRVENTLSLKNNWLKLRLVKYFGIAALHIATFYSLRSLSPRWDDVNHIHLKCMGKSCWVTMQQNQAMPQNRALTPPVHLSWWLQTCWYLNPHSSPERLWENIQDHA